MKKLIIFDMDGTIADTSPGIFASYNYVASKLGVQSPSTDILSTVLGGSLPDNLKAVYSLSNEEVKKVVGIYRDYYSREGYIQSKLYDNFRETALKLINDGYILSIATMKAERFAKKLVDMWGIEKYFNTICGADDKDSLSKSNMIEICVRRAGCDFEEAVMIGDSEQDCMSAQTCGVDFVAVTYGYQYTIEKCSNHNIKYVSSLTQLPSVLKNM